MPVEGWPAAHIKKVHGRLDAMLPGRLEKGSYTDDSQMMLSVLETLVKHGKIDPKYLARRFAENFDPERGYGGRTYDALNRLKNGADWRTISSDSWANGGAMRVGVVGAFFAGSFDEIKAAALAQCRVTHTHPLAMAGACAQALAVGLACDLSAKGEKPQTDAVKAYLAEQIQEISPQAADRLLALPDTQGLTEEECQEALWAEYEMNLRTMEAVCPALGSFLWADSFENAVVMAVSLGGDTDTIGAMTGALAGAYHGLEAIPKAWLDDLEHGPKGVAYFEKLCKEALI
jgi:poly(ADP-ribose) glycohydrolase ARH3